MRTAVFVTTCLIVATVCLYLVLDTDLAQKVVVEIKQPDEPSLKVSNVLVANAQSPQQASKFAVDNAIPESKTDPKCTSTDPNALASDEYQHTLDAYINSLASSENIDDKLASVLYRRAGENETRLDNLLSFHHQYPLNTNVLCELVRECSIFPEDLRCSYELIENVAQLEANNDALWLNIILYFAAHQDLDKIEWAYHKTLQVPYSTNQYIANIRRFVDTVDHSGLTNFNDNLIHAIGTEAAKAVGWKHLLSLCVTSENANLHSDLCLRVGALMENASYTFMDQMFAKSLQKEIHKRLENNKKIEEIEQEIDALSDAFYRDSMLNASLYLGVDESLGREWLDQFQHNGELAAFQYLKEEAEKRSQDSDDFLCKRAILLKNTAGR
ncbi:hypothetical protein FE810_15730 [Thalassotalea litorea]|uniref:Uncharacterized protein n=1 Tax=Thalassotalea litorea TaxID=2020715 RepID=A0A5R9IET1_9GAMM|nr:hypothetical protein [Thalassotalea litorea]TLU61120.1 hypothetical protein FE810_15730 [Thalassotalea litorea]